eukprot:TRINITY_DN51089_c0_g2_i1.p3 TRINITY_DN51089_c0_g2~~TRINITY_DN51089_c0_g2_i1.p3  ORF type:complete len:102 (+),score=26.56 TRINITY_DN51089_c0_g2_i1:19-324(+)
MIRGNFFFSSRRRHTRCREVSWARRCVQETGSILCQTSCISQFCLFSALEYKNGKKAQMISSFLSQYFASDQIKNFGDSILIADFPFNFILCFCIKRLRSS